MFSSTGRDLAPYRAKARAVVHRFNTRGWHLVDISLDDGASDVGPVIERCCGRARSCDIFVLILGVAYGHVPSKKGQTVEERYQGLSITEIEFETRIETGDTNIIVMQSGRGCQFDWNWADDDEDDSASLKRLRRKARQKYLSSDFRNEHEFAEILSERLEDWLDNQGMVRPAGSPVPGESEIPSPPTPYEPHRYQGLETQSLIGRDDELAELTRWAADATQPSLYIVEALGGQGKSALTWNWFTGPAASADPPFDGRMWWSFYALDAGFPEFEAHLLSYLTGEPLAETRQLKRSARHHDILAALRRGRYLVVLDGFERELHQYAVHAVDRDDDPAEQGDDPPRQPDAVAADFNKAQATGPGDARGMVDKIAADLLRELADCRPSRILMSTRRVPRDLMGRANRLPDTIGHMPLPGLRPEDTGRELLEALEVFGRRESLEDLVARVGGHPLALIVAAGEILKVPHDGDLDGFLEAHPSFKSSDLDLRSFRSHIFQFVMAGLDEARRDVLTYIAGSDMPVRHADLVDVFVRRIQRFASSDDLAEVLDELCRVRGLIEFDRRRQTYGMHPLVRDHLDALLEPDRKNRTQTERAAFLASLPETTGRQVPKSDREPAFQRGLELFEARVASGDFTGAWQIYSNSVHPVLDRRGDVARVALLLRKLFQWPDRPGPNDPPQPLMQDDEAVAKAAHQLADAYRLLGQPAVGIAIVNLARKHVGDSAMLRATNLLFRASMSHDLGQFHAAIGDLIEVLVVSRTLEDRLERLDREVNGLVILAQLLAEIGDGSHSQLARARALHAVRLSQVPVSRGVNGWLCTSGFSLAGRRRAHTQMHTLASRLLAHHETLADALVPLAKTLLAEACYQLGRIDAGEDLAHDAARTFYDMHRLSAYCTIHMLRAEGLAVAGDFGTARWVLDESRFYLGRIQFDPDRLVPRALAARLAVARASGDRQQCIAEAERVLGRCLDGVPATHFVAEAALEMLEDGGCAGQAADWRMRLPPQVVVDPAVINPRDDLWIDPDDLPPVDWM